MNNNRKVGFLRNHDELTDGSLETSINMSLFLEAVDGTIDRVACMRLCICDLNVGGNGRKVRIR